MAQFAIRRTTHSGSHKDAPMFPMGLKYSSQYFIDRYRAAIYNLCMLMVVVKEADLNRVRVPGDYEVLDATALGKRLGLKRGTVLAYLSRGNYRNIPRPNRKLAMGPIWYETSVREWESARRGDADG